MELKAYFIRLKNYLLNILYNYFISFFWYMQPPSLQLTRLQITVFECKKWYFRQQKPGCQLKHVFVSPFDQHFERYGNDCATAKPEEACNSVIYINWCKVACIS